MAPPPTQSQQTPIASPHVSQPPAGQFTLPTSAPGGIPQNMFSQFPPNTLFIPATSGGSTTPNMPMMYSSPPDANGSPGIPSYVFAPTTDASGNVHYAFPAGAMPPGFAGMPAGMPAYYFNQPGKTLVIPDLPF